MKKLTIIFSIIFLLISTQANATTLISACGLPSSKTVQVRIYDITDTALDVDYTATGVTERASGQGDSCYYYSATLEQGHGYQVDWKDNSTPVNVVMDIMPENSISTVVASSVTGAVGSVTGAVGSVTGAVGSVTGAVGSVAAGVTVTTNNDKTGYTVSTVSDKTGYALTSAYDPAKTAAQASTALSNVTWTDTKAGYVDVAISGRLATAGYTAPDNASISAIKTKTDNLPADPASNTQVATRASQTSVNAIPTNPTLQTTWTDAKAGYLTGAVALNSTVAKDATVAKEATLTTLIPEAIPFTSHKVDANATATVDNAAVADAVWDEALSGHTTAGTAGLALSTASAAGDPWDISLPGSYATGKAGKIVGDYLNASVGNRPTLAQIEASTKLLVKTSGSTTNEVGVSADNKVNANAGILEADKTEIAQFVWDSDEVSTRQLTSAYTEETTPRDMASSVTLTDEDIAAIVAGVGGATITLPVMQGQVYTATALQSREVRLKRGDTPIRLYFDLDDDYTAWTPYFAMKRNMSDDTYIIDPVAAVWTSAANGEGYYDITGSSAFALGKYYGEIELRNGDSKLTAINFTINFLQKVIE